MKKFITVLLLLFIGLMSNRVIVSGLNETIYSSDTLTTDFEDVEEVSEYVALLESYIELGPNAFGTILFDLSDIEGYNHKLQITIEDEIIEIYYSVDELGQLTGIIIYNGIEYQIVDELPLLEDESHEETEILEEETIEDEMDSTDDEIVVDEVEELEEDDLPVLQFKASNGEDFIQVSYFNVEGEQKESVHVLTSVDLEENEITLILDESTSYLRIIRNGVHTEFSTTIVEGLTKFTLNYHDGSLKVIVNALPMVDEFGVVTYEYEEIIKNPAFGIGIGRPENPGKSNESPGLKLGLYKQETEEEVTDVESIEDESPGNAYGKDKEKIENPENEDDAEELEEDEIENPEDDDDTEELEEPEVDDDAEEPEEDQEGEPVVKDDKTNNGNGGKPSVDDESEDEDDSETENEDEKPGNGYGRDKKNK